jgi:tripartite-type tricarboxylate transporter receptor subunit TctC
MVFPYRDRESIAFAGLTGRYFIVEAKSYVKRLFAVGVIGALMISFPAPAPGQAYPNKPITIYCGYAAGASTDVTARALAAIAEKSLGVPVVVENKAGGSATVCAALVASKPPDGYTLAILDMAAITVRPHLLKVAFNPLTDFTFFLQYGLYVGGLCVLSESPIKTVDEFIAHAKANPGLAYGASGQFSRGHIAMELFAKCKGLTFKHVPFKGGAEADTALLGKHLDFVGGSGGHIPYVKQGAFRMLMVFSMEKRDSQFPNIPMQKELGCEDVPPNTYILIGPKGIPEPVYKKVHDSFKKAGETAEFQKLMESQNLPYGYKSRAQLEKEIPEQLEWYRINLQKWGVGKK